MATVTLNRLRELLAREVGWYFSGTASSGSTSTLADNTSDGFARIPDNILKGKWVHIVTDAGGSAAAPEGDTRKISGISTVTATVDTNFSAAVASGDTYEILPHDVYYYNDAIFEAIRKVYPDLYLELIDETLVVDNLLDNWDFETTTAGPAFTSWSSVGTPTLTEVTSRFIHGTQSAGIEATGATEGLEQDIFTSVNVNEVVGKALHVRGWVWCATADSARLRVTHDGSTFDNSNYHAGDDEWEYLRIDSSVDAGADEMTVSCEVAAGITAYFDAVVAWVTYVSKYTLPTTFLTAPHRVSVQADLNDPAGHYVPLVGCPLPGAILRFEGKGLLSVPTTGTGTTEVSENQAELIVALAASVFHRRVATLDLSASDEHRGEAERWANHVDLLRRRPGVRMAGMPAFIPKHGDYRYSADSSGRYFNLPR